MVKELLSYSGKKVLITGHTGFKGSWLCLLLETLGAKVYGYSLSPPTHPNFFSEARIDRLVHTCIGDVRTYQAMKDFISQIEPEYIFHMAAQPLVRQSYHDPIETYATNVMGTANLLDIARNVQSIRAVVVITTDKCYENKEWIWAYRENEPLGGHDPYSSSKACAELVTSAFRSSYFNTKTNRVGIASARAGNVVGGGDWATDRLIPDFLRAISKGEILRIRNPNAIRPWQHVLEPLTGYLMLGSKLVEDAAAFSDSWNFGPADSDARNVEWISKELCRLWGEDASYNITAEVGEGLHEATYLKLDSSKAMIKLGWHPKWDIEKALVSIVDWHKNWLSGGDVEVSTRRQIEDYFSA